MTKKGHASEPGNTTTYGDLAPGAYYSLPDDADHTIYQKVNDAVLLERQHTACDGRVVVEEQNG